MTAEQLQEEISKAYLHAVAAKCGFAVGQWSQDHGCVDATVSAAGALGGGRLAKPKVDVQLKATRREDVEKDDHLAWTLDVAHHEALRAESHVPHLLVILLLPADPARSVEHTVDQLVIRRCGFWTHLGGAASAPPGHRSITVHVPKVNVLSPDGLRGILTRISQGLSP